MAQKWVSVPQTIFWWLFLAQKERTTKKVSDLSWTLERFNSHQSNFKSNRSHYFLQGWTRRRVVCEITSDGCPHAPEAAPLVDRRHCWSHGSWIWSSPHSDDLVHSGCANWCSAWWWQTITRNTCLHTSCPHSIENLMREVLYRILFHRQHH